MLFLVFEMHICKKKNETNFSDETAPYTKIKEEEFVFKATDRIELVSKCCEVIVKESQDADIKVKLFKKVGDRKEDNLEKELDKITCQMTGERLELGYQGEEQSVNSCYAKAEISLPSTLLDVKCDCYIGDVTIEGTYDTVYVQSNTGDVKLNLDKINENGKYVIDGTIGNVKIKLPKNSNIQICGTQKDNVKVANDIHIENKGAIVEVNKTISDVKIIS